MPLIFLVFFAAFMLELIGTYVSVLGLATLSSPVLIILAITFDYAKLVAVSVLYKSRKELPFFIKLYLVPALLVLMFITSYGAYGFLIQEFKKTLGTHETAALKISLMVEEQSKLESRKIAIDDQISQLPTTYVTQRKRLNEMFAPELDQINSRLQTLSAEIPKLKLSAVDNSNKVSAMANIAEFYAISVNDIIKYVALGIVFVFDPLAVILIIVGNFLIEERKKHRLQLEKEAAASEKKEGSQIKFDKEKADPVIEEEKQLSASQIVIPTVEAAPKINMENTVKEDKNISREEKFDPPTKGETKGMGVSLESLIKDHDVF